VTVRPGGRLPAKFDRPEFERYRIEEEVGAGGMSVVYAARDVELDRQVALKVMRRDVGETQDQERLREEARALAGLNHANIVPVYDVGYAKDGRLYMSMELVRGKSLREWVDVKPRSVAEVLGVLIEAGRGLAAAHAVALVHCDFKPSNVLVGEDGRVRVVDFGIARRVLLSETITARSIGDDSETRDPQKKRPQVIGTPRYMSPEQVRAHPLDAKTDQFSFCLTLYESLYGQLPFLGTSNRQRLRNIVRGNIRKQPRGSLVSGRVHSIISRGLAASPDDRWRSMEELLRALTRALNPSRPWIPLLGVGALGCGIAAAAAMPHDTPCATTRKDVDAMWNADRRERLRDAFRTSGLPNADTEFERVDTRLTTFAEVWADSRRRVCEDDSSPNEVRAAQRSCLYRGLEQLEVLVEVLGSADLTTVRDANIAVAALPNVALCESGAANVGTDIPEHLRERVEELDEELSTAPLLVKLHRYRRAEELTSRILHEAEQLGHPPLLANAQYRRADVLASRGMQVDAAELFEKAFHTAETARMDALAAEIAVDLQLTYGYRLARPKLAERWTKLARAAVERLGDDGAQRAEFVRTEGLIALRSSDFAKARERFEATIELYDRIDDPDPLPKAEALSNLGIACLDLGLLDESEDAFQKALALTEDEVGPYNNRLISIINNLGSLEQARGRHQAAYDYFQRVYEAELALYGPVDVRIAMSLNNLGTSLSALRRDDEAKGYYQRSIAAYESGDHHGVDLARPVGNLAVAYMRADQLDEAEAALLRAIELIEAESGPMQADLSVHWFNLASVRLQREEYGRAREALERCNEIDEAALGHDHPNVAQNLAAIASIHVKLDEPARARQLLEEALTIFGKFDLDPVLVSYAEFELAKLLWDDGERDRARTLVTNAEKAFTEGGSAAAPQLEGLDAWKKSAGYE
jgi:tetratricopeptide (TPR) repeat protein/predicted Ser/Thr protein kinase